MKPNLLNYNCSTNEIGEINRRSPYLSHFTKSTPELEGFALAFRDLDTIIVSTDRDPYIRCTPHYNLKWSDLCYKSGLRSGLPLTQITKTNIENFGKSVLDGSLPFDILILTEAFPQVKEDLETLFTLINQDSSYAKYCQIKKIFLQAKEATKDNGTLDGDQFRHNLESLRCKTLNNFLAGTSMFTADGCIHIANSVLKVAKKVGEKSVTQEDVDTFKRDTEAYKQDSCFTILCNILIGIVIGMLSGMLIGVLLTTPMPLMGATVGAGIVGAGALAFTMWGKTHPIDNVEAHLSHIAQQGVF